MEYPAGGETIDKQEDVAGFAKIFDMVKGLACSEAESAALIHATLATIEDST